MKWNLPSVVRTVVALVMMVAVSMGCAASNNAVQQTRGEAGSVKMGDVSILEADPVAPYFVRFTIELDWPTNADVYWSPYGVLGANRKGIAIQDVDQDGYKKLVSVDLRAVKEEARGLAAEIHITQNDPYSGGANFWYLAIVKRDDVPAERRSKYFEGTPLELVSHEWDKNEKRWTEKWRRSLDPPRN
ncbi:hypothetical protein EPO05_00580 [Patescibacteria group bacterium]|nr:MAG: hypothetical protein EPO05_00580 [Patescibacteria group bacterium]